MAYTKITVSFRSQVLKADSDVASNNLTFAVDQFWYKERNRSATTYSPPFLCAHISLHFVLLGFSSWFFSAQPETSLRNLICFCVQFGTSLKLPAIKAFKTFQCTQPWNWVSKSLRSTAIIYEMLLSHSKWVQQLPLSTLV